MEKIRQIIEILRGNRKTRFGLDHALDIFRQTKGRYADDETKAVPFAILTTAQALGAEVTIHEEGADELENIQAATQTHRTRLENMNAQTELAIRHLLELVEKKKLSLDDFASQTRIILNGFETRKEEIHATLNFFTV